MDMTISEEIRSKRSMQRHFIRRQRLYVRRSRAVRMHWQLRWQANLRPGDELLSISGRPYDTLEEVIGIRPSCGRLSGRIRRDLRARWIFWRTEALTLTASGQATAAADQAGGNSALQGLSDPPDPVRCSRSAEAIAFIKERQSGRHLSWWTIAMGSLSNALEPSDFGCRYGRRLPD